MWFGFELHPMKFLLKKSKSKYTSGWPRTLLHPLHMSLILLASFPSLIAQRTEVAWDNCAPSPTLGLKLDLFSQEHRHCSLRFYIIHLADAVMALSFESFPRSSCLHTCGLNPQSVLITINTSITPRLRSKGLLSKSSPTVPQVH